MYLLKMCLSGCLVGAVIDPADADTLWNYQLVSVAAHAVKGKIQGAVRPQLPGNGRMNGIACELKRRREFCIFPIFFDHVDARIIPSAFKSCRCFRLQRHLTLQSTDLKELYACLSGQSLCQQPRAAHQIAPVSTMVYRHGVAQQPTGCSQESVHVEFGKATHRMNYADQVGGLGYGRQVPLPVRDQEGSQLALSSTNHTFRGAQAVADGELDFRSQTAPPPTATSNDVGRHQEGKNQDSL